MSKLDEQAWLVVVAAQQFVKTGDRSRLEQFGLDDLRQAERELGRRDAAEPWRDAIQERIGELRAAEPRRVYTSGVRRRLDDAYRWFSQWL
jgi:hypothetical protein